MDFSGPSGGPEESSGGPEGPVRGLKIFKSKFFAEVPKSELDIVYRF